MDLHTIEEIVVARRRDDLAPRSDKAALLAGGTWLFSEPQPHLERLIDITALDWPAIEADSEGLRLAATCTFAALHAWAPPPEWTAATLIPQCCDALLGSFKVWNVATIGGNICLALPAGPMIALTAALDGVCLVWTPDGETRRLPVEDFVTGAQRTALEPGDVLRAVEMPAAALRRRTAFRQISLTPLGRSAALLIGTLDRDGGFTLTVTASLVRPMKLRFDALPAAAALVAVMDARIDAALYHDDVHGRPAWRRHITYYMAEEIRRELAGDAAAH